MSEANGKGSERETHPAWGVISLSHTSGHMRMFRSATVAHSMVTLRVHRASMHTRHGEKRPWPEEQVVEVRLTPLQFAELITQPNRGEGAACTLTYLGGARVPEPPEEGDELHDHAEAAGKIGVFESASLLKALIEKVEGHVDSGRPLGTKALRELLSEIKVAHMHSTSDVDYWRKEMAERARHLRARVATDLHATADLIIRNMGLGALADKARAMLPSLPEPHTLDVDDEGEQT